MGKNMGPNFVNITLKQNFRDVKDWKLINTGSIPGQDSSVHNAHVGTEAHSVATRGSFSRSKV